jgi:uncharacterized protein (TIGR03435 family)
MRNLNWSLIAGILAMFTSLTNSSELRAQAQADLRFEVASVRRVEILPTANGGVPVFPVTDGIGTPNPTRITYKAVWLRSLIAESFGVRSDQITGPDWLTRERYDVIANIPEGATREQFNIMVGNLLRDRFRLRFHLDSKTVPVYALRVAKNGPKFKETTARRKEDGAAPSPIKGLDAQGFPVLPPDYSGQVSFPANGEMFTTAQDVPMANFARAMESRAGRPIIDETGLAGRYDFKFHFEFAGRPTPGVASVSSAAVFSAIEDQLGLKLEPSTSTFPHMIIDSIEREPTDN